MSLTRDDVLRLLKDRTTPICPTCVSKQLAVPFQRAFDAMLDIELRRDYAIRGGACGDCGVHRSHVIWPPRR